MSRVVIVVVQGFELLAVSDVSGYDPATREMSMQLRTKYANSTLGQTDPGAFGYAVTGQWKFFLDYKHSFNVTQ